MREGLVGLVGLVGFVGLSPPTPRLGFAQLNDVLDVGGRRMCFLLHYHILLKRTFPRCLTRPNGKCIIIT